MAPDDGVPGTYASCAGSVRRRPTASRVAHRRSADVPAGTSSLPSDVARVPAGNVPGASRPERRGGIAARTPRHPDAVGAVVRVGS
ncbi:hypothetical protein SDC9_209472 [bioreactor metagenome]|uniref:Uncharacterized protein n=1 Tax=bioreactor metagenome TaxID=1076179 RepID=A0A645JF67_9ZZZZ